MRWEFFRLSEEGEVTTMIVDVWLYGSLACYGHNANLGGFAHVKKRLANGITMADLLSRLGIPTEDRGITFINGQLSAMPGFILT